MNERSTGQRRTLLLHGATLLGGLAAGGVSAGLPRTALAQGAPAAVQRVTVKDAAQQLAGGGWILMMRHEQTVPGVGDPPNFSLDDCATQRNLSDAGRARARRAGEAMRAAGLVPAVVRAGRWCRVRETAELAFGRFETWTALDSFFGQSERAGAHRERVIDFARSYAGSGHAMLVTHQVNITGALEVYPEMGEVIAARLEQGTLRARLRFVPGAD
ncbi:MAG: histidine phosphatase family protein [Burkholderiaceae bacterium]|jgi:phosphohistidine phosphatase SixA